MQTYVLLFVLIVVEGVNRDHKKACSFYLKAKALGNENAAELYDMSCEIHKNSALLKQYIKSLPDEGPEKYPDVYYDTYANNGGYNNNYNCAYNPINGNQIPNGNYTNCGGQQQMIPGSTNQTTSKSANTNDKTNSSSHCCILI